MKLYLNTKTGKYYVASWSCKITEGKLNYFEQGKGWQKVSVKFVKEIEVEINKPETYLESWEIYKVYGRNVLKEVIENNAEYWKDNYCLIVSAGEKACKLYDQFQEYFKVNILRFVDFTLLYFGVFSFDIIKFDTYISNQFGYDINKLVSLKEFIRITFGNEQVKCIENLIDFYEYTKPELI